MDFIINHQTLVVVLGTIGAFILIMLGLLAWQFKWFSKFNLEPSRLLGRLAKKIILVLAWVKRKIPRPKRQKWLKRPRKPSWLTWSNIKRPFGWICEQSKRQGGKLMKKIFKRPSWLRFKPIKSLIGNLSTGGVRIVAIMLTIDVLLFAGVTKLETGIWFKPNPYFSFAVIIAGLGYLYIVDAIMRGLRPENQVPEDMLGLRLFKGYALDTVGSGPPVLPRWLINLRTEKRKVHQKQFPGEDKDVYLGEMKPDPNNPDAPIIPPGMVPPVRVTFGTSITDEEAQNLLGDDYEVETSDGRTIKFNANVPDDGLSTKRVTAELAPFIRYRIVDLRSFVQNIGSFDEADRQIEDTMFAVLVRYYTRMSVAQALHNIDWMNTLLFKRLEHRTGLIEGKSLSWGIDIEDANLKSINFNHSLNTAIANANMADFVAQKLERESEGEKVQLTNRGQGDANALRMKTREELKGRASGVKALAKETGIDATEIYGGIIAAEVTNGQGTTFIPGLPGLKDLAGATAAVFNGNKEKK